MTTDWRAFEVLVARMEASLAPKGAAIKSPDRIRDLVTGKLREVDASIRFQVGSTPILITVECRRRVGIQDDTWIEQLATKRTKIGAAKTIAVSATGFSESAVKTAELNGIELRSLEDRIEDDIVQQFLSGFRMSLIVTDFVTRTVSFELDDGSALPGDQYADELIQSLTHDGADAPLATDVTSGHHLTPNAIIRRVADHDVPLNGPVVTKTVTVTFSPRTVVVKTKTGERFVRRLELVVDFTKREIVMPATSLYEYATPEKALKHVIEAKAVLNDKDGVSLEIDISSPVLEKRSPGAGHQRRPSPTIRRRRS